MFCISFIICNLILVFLDFRFLTFIPCTIYIYILSFVTNLSRYFILILAFRFYVNIIIVKRYERVAE